MSRADFESSSDVAPFKGVDVTIQNDLDVPVDIFDVFNPAVDGQIMPYSYTKLATIGAKSSGKVTTIRSVAMVEAMYTGPVEALQNTYYHRFPIKFMSGTQFTVGPPSPPSPPPPPPPPLSYTIAETDRQAMIQSFLFHKFAMANPNSALTKNLNIALKGANPKAVDDFFAGTQNFKSCTLGTWNAVMTWLTMFTSGWQGPYYLYETAPASPPPGYTPALVGTLNIVSSASDDSATLKLCSQATDGSLTPNDPPQGSTLVMAGDGTMTDQDPGQDVDASLTPVWMNVIQTTMANGSPKTSYIAGPALSGTVAGTKVVSTQTLIPLPSQADDSGSSLFSWKTFDQICEVVGFIVGLVMLYEIVEKRWNSKQQADEKSKSESKNEDEYKAKTEANDNQASEDLAKTLNEPTNAKTITENSAAVGDGYAAVSTTQQEGVLTKTMENTEQTFNTEINTQLEDGLTPSTPFETAVTQVTQNFATANQQIAGGDVAGASATMSQTAQVMNETVSQNAQSLQQSETNALTNSAEVVQTAADSANTLNEAQSKYETNSQNMENDSGAPAGDVTPDVAKIPGDI